MQTMAFLGIEGVFNIVRVDAIRKVLFYHGVNEELVLRIALTY